MLFYSNFSKLEIFSYLVYVMLISANPFYFISIECYTAICDRQSCSLIFNSNTLALICLAILLLFALYLLQFKCTFVTLPNLLASILIILL